MFQGYFDESGVHADSSMFVLAGYVAPEKEWNRFIPKWRAVLNRYGISVFHASQCNSNKGEFEKFADRREERNQFVEELLNLIGERPRILAFHSAVAVREFSREMLVRISPKTTGHPYYVAMKSLMCQIALAMNQRGYPKDKRVALVFDRHSQLSAYAVELFNRSLDEQWTHKYRFATIGFSSKEQVIPLQAADAFAYDSSRELERTYYHSKRKQRPSYHLLSKHLAFRTHIWNQTEIARFKMMTFDILKRVLERDAGRVFNDAKITGGLFS